MRHLKSYKVFEADFFAADNFDEIKSYLEDIFLELTDEGFRVEIYKPNLRNMYRLKISIICQPGGNAVPFRLEDIKNCVESSYDYLESVGVNYFLDQIDAFGPNFKNYGEIEISKDTIEWDLSQELVMLDLFFDKDERNYQMGGLLQKFNESATSYEIEKNVRDILLELTDDGEFEVRRVMTSKDLELVIVRSSYPNSSSEKREIPGAPVPPGGGYPSDVFLWMEIKDTIIRLCEYVYSETEFTPGINSKTFNDLRNMGIKYESNAPFRMFSGGTEFGVGWHKAEDFTLGDFISFTSLKLVIKL